MSQFDLTTKNRSCYKCKGLGQIHSSIPIDRSSRNAPSFQKCKGCLGTGTISYEAILCEKCLGRGTIHDHTMTHTMNCKYCKECVTCSSKGWVEAPSRQETSDIFPIFQQSKFQPFSLPTLKELDAPSSPLKSLGETMKEPKSAVLGSKKAAPEDSLFAFMGARVLGPPTTTKPFSQFQPSFEVRPASPASSSKARSQSLQRPGRKMTPMMDNLDHFMAKFAAEAGVVRAPKPIMKERI